MSLVRNLVIGGAVVIAAHQGFLFFKRRRMGTAGTTLAELSSLASEVIEDVKESAGSTRDKIAGLLGNEAIQSSAGAGLSATAGAYCGPQCAQGAAMAWQVTEPLRDASHEVVGAVLGTAWDKVTGIF